MYMNYIVSITSQGQISIPMPLRRKYGLDKFRKAIISSTQEGNLIIEPFSDLLSLKGIIKTKKKVSSRQIREEFEKYLASQSK